MYHQVPGDSINSQPSIGSHPLKVAVALISASCAAFMVIMISPVSFSLLDGTTADQSTSLATMSSTLHLPKTVKGARPAPGFLRFPQMRFPDGNRQSSINRASASDQAHADPRTLSRSSMVKGIAAAFAGLGVRSTHAAEVAQTLDPKDLPPKIKVLQMISSWDTDKDGRISRAEFDKGMGDYVPHELTPGQLDASWDRIVNAQKDINANDPSYRGNTLTDAQKQMPAPGQQMPLPTNRVESSIPKYGTDGTFKYPSPQQAYNAMLRKGKDPDISRARDFVETHNEMNERGWEQVLQYESVTHPECPRGQVKLRKFNGDYAGRVEGSFDRHHWIVNRCGTEEMTYVLDYFDTKKFDDTTMPYSNDDIEIQVQPDPDDPNAQADINKFEKAKGKKFVSTADILPSRSSLGVPGLLSGALRRQTP
eukprot:gnl/MRDRNA2_/MRDRNA2_108341_c0_seq1.p1 gnl/MRDRNA2_/MRDRNA2_108341_c0~~gnl/MRDRNA2_/MRDRNA2_108341_c0_seq1.p1  ORF type:complete len:423 (+),score=71.97 gnl/MRDRNA2_/MRDRNA2_108341_c0_seq1:96-1364(+)